MKFGIALPNYGKYAGRKSILELSLAAEEYGFDSIWVSDHLVVPTNHKGFGSVFFDPIITLSYIASKTKNIKLGTSVIVLPYRNPVTFAKSVSTLDVLSDGRVILGIGAGWLEDEFKALGVNYKEKDEIVNEYIEIIIELFQKESPEFNGKYFVFKDINFYPKPIRKPFPPIWIGGSSKNAIRRAVNYGGWHAVGLTPDVIKAKSEEIRSFFKSGNKDIKDFVISIRKNLQITDRDIKDESEILRGNIEKIYNGIEAYRDAGVTYILLQVLSSSFKGTIDSMKEISDQFIL